MTTGTFIVVGPPQPWQRAGSSAKGVRYTQKETKLYQQAIKVQALVAGFGRPEWPKDARYSVAVHAYFANRRDRDLDNVAKSVCDALNGVAYDDDSQIDKLVVERKHDKEHPRTVIRLEVIP